LLRPASCRTLQAGSLRSPDVYFGAREATHLRRGYGAVRRRNRLPWGKRINDLFEARIAPQRIPKREQLQGAVVGNHISSLRMSSSRQLLQGELLLTGPGGDDGEIDKHSASVHGISVHREKLDRAPAFA